MLAPSQHGLRARFRVAGYPHERWWLHDQLEIVGCRVDGRSARVRRYPDGPEAPFSPYVHQVEVAQQGTILEFEVVGTIPDVEAEVNCLAPELTELAVYAAWHPVFLSLPRFEFTLDLQIDGEPLAAVNGVRLDEPTAQGTRWRSVSSGVDIVVVASPAFVEVLHERLPVRALASGSRVQDAAVLVELAGSAMSACSSWWGPPSGPPETVTLVLSPREGWPYSRTPLILLPNGSVTTPEAEHTVLHETAHLWWRTARPLSTDDWLNEGLAEYAADRLARDLLPTEFNETRATATLAELAAHPDDEPVLASRQESPAKHRNLYLRPAVALDGLERRIGAEALDGVLRAWLTIAADSPLTTAAALALLEQHAGTDHAAYLRDALTTAGWRPQGAVR